MRCQILFSRKNKKNIAKCRLLNFLPNPQKSTSSDPLGLLGSYITYENRIPLKAARRTEGCCMFSPHKQT